MQRIVLIVVILLASVIPSQAQGVDSYQAKYYNVGATQPLQQSDSFASTAAVCNQDPPPLSLGTVNPRRIIWDDTANAGKVCIYQVPTGGGLLSLPLAGSFEGTLSACNGAGCTESSRSPFSRLQPPAARTGTRFTP